jgi:hypothetical protein
LHAHELLLDYDSFYSSHIYQMYGINYFINYLGAEIIIYPATYSADVFDIYIGYDFIIQIFENAN